MQQCSALQFIEEDSKMLPFKSNDNSQKYWSIEDDVIDWEEKFREQYSVDFTFIVKRPVKFWNKYDKY